MKSGEAYLTQLKNIPDLSSDLAQLLSRAWQVRIENFDPVLKTARPYATESISVTGSSCALKCAHCGGHYLNAMTPLASLSGPEAIRGKSCLISGGCTSEGKVPVHPFLKKLAALKGRRRFNFHVGLISKEEMQAIAPLADVVSFDFLGDETTIRQTLKLSKTVDDYRQCYHLLRQYCRKVVPHICLGLKGGQWAGETHALDLLAQEGLNELVFIVLRPTPGTEYAKVEPPAWPQVVRFLAQARIRLPQVQLQLGCMRPGGPYRRTLDPLAVACGLNGIVQPHPAAVELAQKLGLTIYKTEECCAF